VLGNWNNDGLVVGGGVDGGKLVEADIETVSNSGSQFAVGSSSVETFEENKVLRVGGRGLVKGGERLNDDVGMALNLALSVELLRSREIVGLRIDKEAGLHFLDRHLNGESRLRLDCAEILREGKLG